MLTFCKEREKAQKQKIRTHPLKMGKRGENTEFFKVSLRTK